MIAIGKTSTKAKRRYNDKTYSRIVVDVPKETAAAFRAKCKKEQVPIAQILKAAIDQFLKE